jgi:DNA-binding transcriptional ArsR family regulator
MLIQSAAVPPVRDAGERRENNSRGHRSWQVEQTVPVTGRAPEDQVVDELGRVFETVSRYFSLLSEPMRVRILHVICQEERTVSQIVAETGATQTNVSRHLNTMYRAGVLTRRKEGNFIYYGVADRTLTEICRNVCVHIATRQDGADADQAGLATLAQGLVNAAAPAGDPEPSAG